MLSSLLGTDQKNLVQNESTQTLRQYIENKSVDELARAQTDIPHHLRQPSDPWVFEKLDADKEHVRKLLFSALEASKNDDLGSVSNVKATLSGAYEWALEKRDETILETIRDFETDVGVDDIEPDIPGGCLDWGKEAVQNNNHSAFRALTLTALSVHHSVEYEFHGTNYYQDQKKRVYNESAWVAMHAVLVVAKNKSPQDGVAFLEEAIDEEDVCEGYVNALAFTHLYRFCLDDEEAQPNLLAETKKAVNGYEFRDTVETGWLYDIFPLDEDHKMRQLPYLFIEVAIMVQGRTGCAKLLNQAAQQGSLRVVQDILEKHSYPPELNQYIMLGVLYQGSDQIAQHLLGHDAFVLEEGSLTAQALAEKVSPTPGDPEERFAKIVLNASPELVGKLFSKSLIGQNQTDILKYIVINKKPTYVRTFVKAGGLNCKGLQPDERLLKGLNRSLVLPDSRRTKPKVRPPSIVFKPATKECLT